MAKAPEKKPGASDPTVTRVLPIQSGVGDRLTDETGEYEVIGRPYTMKGGKALTLTLSGCDGRTPLSTLNGRIPLSMRLIVLDAAKLPDGGKWNELLG